MGWNSSNWGQSMTGTWNGSQVSDSLRGAGGIADEWMWGTFPRSDARTQKAVDNLSANGRDMAAIGGRTLDIAADQTRKYTPAFDNSIGLDTAMSREQYDRYLSDFAPLEGRVAKDAMEWDSPDMLDRVSQQASADVHRGFDSARAENERALRRSGVNVDDPRYLRATRDLGLTEAAADAGAMTGARERRIGEAMSLRGGAAQFGRALPATAAAAAAQGAATASTAAGLPITLSGAAQPWFTGATTAEKAAGDLANSEFKTVTDAYTQRRDSQSKQMTTFGGQMMGFSSEELKTDKKPIDGEAVLVGIEKIPVEKWKYKDGVADEGRHIGPYAEDVNKQFGDKAAPGGVGLDMMTMNGLNMAAIQELAKKVRKIEGGLDSARTKVKSRPTEPGFKQPPEEGDEALGPTPQPNGSGRRYDGDGLDDVPFMPMKSRRQPVPQREEMPYAPPSRGAPAYMMSGATR